MITSILFLMIGLKLNMLNGWYLALVIIKFIFDLIDFGIKMFKKGSEL